MGMVEELRSVEVSVPNLNPVDATRDGGGDEVRQVPSDGLPVDDEGENRSRFRGQNVAIPSRGLDADAYSRRGIRPDS